MRIFKNFIIKHTYIVWASSILIMILCIVVFYCKKIYHFSFSDEFSLLATFATSTITCISTPCYKFGKTRLVISRTWDAIERKYGNTEEAQNKFKEHHLKIASITYPIMILLFIAWCIIEIIIRR